MTSGPEIYRNSFSTDLREHDVIFGGEKKLSGAIDEIAAKFSPKLIFIYATCIVGVIGDDIEAVCKRAREKNLELHSVTIITKESILYADLRAL